MAYRGCVAFREWSERRKIDPLITLGKKMTAVVARFVKVGGSNPSTELPGWRLVK
jgi:hypothetical protein